jgi:beta-mannosidase
MPEILLFAILCLIYTTKCSYISLSDNNWSIYNANQSIHLTNQPVPSSVYLQLYENGKIGDPYWGTNDTESMWVSQTDWTYEYDGKMSNELNGKKVELIAEGIDTISQIFVNDKNVGSTGNMFVKYTFDVTNVLQSRDDGKYNIKISIKSPIKYGDDRAQNYPYVIPYIQYSWPTNRNHIRKKQCSYGWDWTGAFPDSGIWKPIYLRVVQQDVQIDDILPQISPTSKHWVLTVDTILLSVLPRTPTIHYTLTDQQKQVIINEVIQINTTEYSTRHRHVLSIPLDAVKRWYPNGYGEQPLYELTVTTGSFSKTRRLGFRHVELVRDVIPNPKVFFSKSFYFRVNGIPIYAKGANLIPFDAFEVRVTHDRIKIMVQAALGKYCISFN